LACVALLVAACGATGGSAPSPLPSTAKGTIPTPTPVPFPPATPAAGASTELPFTLELPAGWVFGPPHDLKAQIETMRSTAPDDAARWDAILKQSATVSN